METKKAAETIMSMCADYLGGGLEESVFKSNIALFSGRLNLEKVKYSEMIKAGNDEQISRMELYENYKYGYEDVDIFTASRKITDHIPRLLKLSVLIHNTHNIPQIKKLAADISNYCHMIIFKCNKLMS